MVQFNDGAATTKIADLRKREEESLVRALAPRYGYEYLDLTEAPIDIEALKFLTEEESRAAEAAIFASGNGTVSLAIRNPNHPGVAPLVERLTREHRIPTLFMVSMQSLERAWARYSDTKSTAAEAHGILDIRADVIKEQMEKIKTYLDVGAGIATVAKSADSNKISEAIELMFAGALALKASDIHIEPAQATTRIRYRLDGVLSEITDVDKYLSDHIVTRIKLISGLKLNVHKEAQDGRFTIDLGTREVEVRSSVIPGGFGESIVMRLLDPSAAKFKFELLGLNARLEEVMKQELARPNGAIITTGPTGSGKTTALYAFLQAIHSPEVKIITLEDPIEYKLPGIVQTQVNKDYTFSNGLRSILRQDPDSIMVGEIRDHEVAEVAVHAALTGHLVFSTLHTNSAVGGFARLVDLGIDPRMIASAFNIILGQRLVRRLCEDCKEERDTTVEEQNLIAKIMEQPVAIQSVYEAPGCEKCSFTGFKGRIGVMEGIRVDAAVEQALLSDPRESNILRAAKPQNIPTMQQDGVMKVLAGITSLDELTRVLDLYGALEQAKNEAAHAEEEASAHREPNAPEEIEETDPATSPSHDDALTTTDPSTPPDTPAPEKSYAT
jgi:type II secretory ATPase GspE/PulE/Tfp pilus assembly ATPase PilB-like protein